MAEGYLATTETMAQAAAHVRSVNEGVQAELSALRMKLEPVLAAWRGQSATQFFSVMARWDTSALNLNNALGAIGESIQGTGITYESVDAETAGSAFSPIRTVLG